MIKLVFKSIVLTITLTILTMFIIEYHNISVASPSVKSLAQMSLKQSCQYFAQETYKRGNGTKSSSGNGYQLVGYNGVTPTNLSGNFYTGSPTSDYNILYKSSAFKDYISKYRQYWRRLNILGYGLGLGGNINESEKVLADYYVQDMLTPLNIGIAYIDKDTVTKIFRWEYVLSLMNGQPDMLISDSTGSYVKYKGFRIYYDTIKVTNVDYTVYDLLNSADATKFKALTNMDVDGYISKSKIKGNDERRYVMVAKLDYTMKVGYEGITPIKRMMQWAFNTEAAKKNNATDIGIDMTYSRKSDSWDNSSFTGKTSLSGGRNEDAAVNNAKASNDDAYGLASDIIYYIIR